MSMSQHNLAMPSGLVQVMSQERLTILQNFAKNGIASRVFSTLLCVDQSSEKSRNCLNMQRPTVLGTARMPINEIMPVVHSSEKRSELKPWFWLQERTPVKRARQSTTEVRKSRRIETGKNLNKAATNQSTKVHADFLKMKAKAPKSVGLKIPARMDR